MNDVIKWKLVMKQDDKILQEFDVPTNYALKMITLQYQPYTKGNLSVNRRLEVLERDNNKCCICGRSSDEVPLNVHHIILESQGGSADMNNLITLCFKCHREEHERIYDRTEYIRKIEKVINKN